MENRRAALVPVVVVVAVLLGLGWGLSRGAGGEGAGSLPAAPASSSPSLEPLSLHATGTGGEQLVAGGFAAQNGDLVVIDVPTVRQALDALQREDGVVAGYDRQTQFGYDWKDVDRNGCDTRNDVLRRDLTDLQLKAGTHGCKVLSGVLADPYTGESVVFVQGANTSRAVQVDHLWPLGLVWSRGAAGWDQDTRERFANDPINLQATAGRLNESKSDRGPAEWMPPSASVQCEYAARLVLVASRYALEISDRDATALEGTLGRCG